MTPIERKIVSDDLLNPHPHRGLDAHLALAHLALAHLHAAALRRHAGQPLEAALGAGGGIGAPGVRRRTGAAEIVGAALDVELGVRERVRAAASAVGGRGGRGGEEGEVAREEGGAGGGWRGGGGGGVRGEVGGGGEGGGGG